MKKIRIIALVMAAGITFSTIADVGVYAKTAAENQIEANKDKIEDLKNDKVNLDKDIVNEKKKLDEIIKKMDEVSIEFTKREKVVKNYEGKISKLNNEIKGIQSEIAKTKDNIKATEGNIKKNEEERNFTEKILSDRLRSYYKTDFTAQFLNLLCTSGSFSELINNIFSINKIVMTDQELLGKIDTLASKLEEEKTNLSNQKKSLEDNKKAVETSVLEQEELKGKAIAEREKWQKEVDKIESLEKEKNEAIKKINDKKKSIDGEIEDLEVDNESLQNEINGVFDEINNSGSIGSVSSSGFARPSGGPITSPFGYRIHPITGSKTFHKGIDYGAPYGSKIIASNDGVVRHAGWFGGYGKAIIIDHGGGIQSLYAHSSALHVTVGQTVKRGQHIANIGSTGQSTGPHLHFEIRVNSQPVNPAGYVK